MEDPKLTKTIVRREVTRVLTPGTAVDPALASERNNYLAALHVVNSAGGPTSNPVAALALLDLSTGDFRATEFSGPGSLGFCIDELIKAQPSELLLSSGLPPLDPLMEAEIEKIGSTPRTTPFRCSSGRWGQVRSKALGWRPPGRPRSLQGPWSITRAARSRSNCST
jgi:DNA mismatch repair ATPase MutS